MSSFDRVGWLTEPVPTGVEPRMQGIAGVDDAVLGLQLQRVVLRDPLPALPGRKPSL
jgi:hypothetical protein